VNDSSPAISISRLAGKPVGPSGRVLAGNSRIFSGSIRPPKSILIQAGSRR